MKQERFEQAHREEWDALAAMLAAGAGDQRLPQAYRRVCQHLALARDRCYTAGLVQRLNGLVMAGHQALYGSTLGLGPQWGRFLAGGLARSVRALYRPVLLAAMPGLLPVPR